MSLQSSMAVMKAKLAGNTPQLMALAQQGDVEAAAALKEMLDKKAYAQGMANETAMSQEDTLPVLEQIAGNLEAPQSGIAAYAHGGLRRGFFDGGSTYTTADMLTNPRAGGEANYNPIANWFRDKLYGGKTREEYYGEPPPAPPAPPISNAPYPERAGMLHPPKGKTPKPGYTGIAAAAAPRDEDPVERDSGPRGRLAVPPPGAAPAVAGPPAAEDLNDKELLAATEKLTSLQKERDALRGKSREQLEAAYNEKVKTLTPSKFDRVMAFLAGVQEKGGRSAAQALGAGALKMHGLDKASKAQLASAKEAWARADLLEQQAMVADQMKDVDRAMALRKEAMELRRKFEEDKSEAGLRAATARQADANAYYIRNIKPDVEQMEADAARTRANRTGAGGGAGKPMTAAQLEAAIERGAANRAKQDGKDLDMLDPKEWDVYRAQAKQAILVGQGKTAARPAGPKAYDFGALMQGK